jgi:hypothetical protein
VVFQFFGYVHLSNVDNLHEFGNKIIHFTSHFAHGPSGQGAFGRVMRALPFYRYASVTQALRTVTKRYW